MAESRKGISSSVDPKEKSLSLDEEIGKEFLSSWKSLSVAGDDTMDFSFDTVSSGKKKTFNFDKLDMDFNLDGDFDKLTSFKVDMPDLDFSPPSKKTSKPKESSKEESSSGNHQGKRDGFTFSFDFNELDNFNFDSTIIQGSKTSMKNLESEVVGSDKSGYQGSKVNMASGDDVFDNSHTDKVRAQENATTIVETSLVGAATENSSNDNVPSRSRNFGDLVVSLSARISPEKTASASAEEADQQGHILEKTMPTRPYAQQTTQILPVQSVDGDKSVQDTESDVQACSMARKLNTESGAEEDVTDRIIGGVGSNHENLQLKNLAPPYCNGSESSRGECEKTQSETPPGNITENEPMQDNLDFETTFTANILQTRPHDKDIQESTSKLLVPLRSEPAANNMTTITEKESEVVCSKSFKRSKETEPQLCQQLSTGVEVSSFGSKGMAAICPANGKREGFNVNEAQTQKKLIGGAKLLSMELTKGEPSMLESEKNVKNLCNIREGFNGDGIQSVCKLVTNPRPPDKHITKGDSVVLGGGMNMGCEVNPASSTDKATKSNTQTSVNSTAVASSMGSAWNSKMICVEGLKAGKRTPDLSSLKILRTVGASKDQSNSVLKRGLSSLRNSEKSMEIQGTTVSKTVHPIANSERKTLLITSLKRKTYEASNADMLYLNPRKRLSQSPNEIRNLKEPLKSTVEEQGCNHDNQAKNETNSVLYSHSTCGLETSQRANMKEQDISLAMENDGNVEKAEAYAKELEGICNMLRKKHEEAKEILVRAIVNNNSLLMLNHPMFDEKLRMVQKFAAQLMSN